MHDGLETLHFCFGCWHCNGTCGRPPLTLNMTIMCNPCRKSQYSQLYKEVANKATTTPACKLSTRNSSSHFPCTELETLKNKARGLSMEPHRADRVSRRRGHICTHVCMHIYIYINIRTCQHLWDGAEDLAFEDGRR